MELRKNKPLRSFGFFPKRPLGSLKDKVKGAWNRRAEKRALHLEKKGKTHAEGAKETLGGGVNSALKPGEKTQQRRIAEQAMYHQTPATQPIRTPFTVGKTLYQ